jgi:hypothetical protein
MSCESVGWINWHSTEFSMGFYGLADESSDFIDIVISSQTEHLSTAKGSACTRELVMQCAVSL